jgi:hypothetical protein
VLCRWYAVVKDGGAVVVRMADYQLPQWKKHLTAAGFSCECNSIWTGKPHTRTLWLPQEVMQRNMFSVDNNHYVVAHKVNYYTY